MTQPTQDGPASDGPASNGASPGNPAPKGLLDRLKSMERRTWLLIATGALLAIFFLFFDGCSGAEVSEEEALATARAAFEQSANSFVPEKTQVQFLRQDFPPKPVWAVVFSIPDPEGGRHDYLQYAAVVVHATTGRVMEINIDGVISEPNR